MKEPHTAPQGTTITVLDTSLAAQNGVHTTLADRLNIELSARDWAAVRDVEKARPRPLRAFDQISMRGEDLLRQAKLVGPYLCGKRVAFMGDLDGASLLFGRLAAEDGDGPAEMLLLDFDERLLVAATEFATVHGFASCLTVRRYNAFDPLPSDLVRTCDWFYTNPPYGSGNDGASARLFIARGCELTDTTEASGCIILPYDAERPWTRHALLTTQGALQQGGWAVRAQIDHLHQYHLDDDRELTSAMIVVDRVAPNSGSGLPFPYVGKRVPFADIPRFYGRDIVPPYPRYIHTDGTYDYAWDDASEEAA